MFRSSTQTPEYCCRPAPGEERQATSQGHPRAVFRRALERGNVVVAEVTARELGRLDLSESLELTALVALRNRERGGRFAVRWLKRWLDEADTPTIEEATVIGSCLAALGGPAHDTALAALRAVAQAARPAARSKPQ
jgi:hypothetical protein